MLGTGDGVTNPPSAAVVRDGLRRRSVVFDAIVVGLSMLLASSHSGADRTRGRWVSLKQRLPLLRWSFWRQTIGFLIAGDTGQIGDGREAAAADYVLSHARRGDIDDVLAAFDTFAYNKSLLMNVGDEKGQLLDAAVHRAAPDRALELGTYCGYGALRIARAAPGACVYSIELAEANATIARSIWAHAGVADRVICIVGTIGDGGTTTARLTAKHGFSPGELDFLFIDHHKSAYVEDLKTILGLGWLRQGSIVVADNIIYPGAPRYRRYMHEQQGKLFDTVEHKTHLEYQTLIPDLVLESEYLAT
jgi:catechol O-methyltransferase